MAKIPSHQVPNVVSAIEHYFQKELGDKLFEDVSNLSDGQFRTLTRDYSQPVVHTSHVIGSRGSTSYSVSPPPEFNCFATGEINAHDASLKPSIDASLPETPRLKHVALLCDRTLVRNPLPLYPALRRPFEHAKPETFTRQGLVSRLRQLLPIAPLIRSGCLVLVDAPLVSTVGHDMVSPGYLLDDPYVSYLLRNRPDIVDSIQAMVGSNTKRALDAAKLRPDIDAGMLIRNFFEELSLTSSALEEAGVKLIAEVYQPRLSLDTLKYVLWYARQAREGLLSTVTTDAAVTHHLRQGARILLGANFEIPASSAGLAEISPAVTYGIPSLSEISFGDIAQIRNNESIFPELRDALVALNAACAAEQPADYDAYLAAVTRHAKEILAPAHAHLREWEKKARTRKWRGKVLGEGAALSVDVLAGGLPVGGLISGIVDHATGGGKARRIQKDTDIAYGILKSIT